VPDVLARKQPATSLIYCGRIPRFMMWMLCCIAGVSVCSLFKSLVPLWGRQIPYTMMKFGESLCCRIGL
jgi:hypothetical protein